MKLQALFLGLTLFIASTNTEELPDYAKKWQVICREKSGVSEKVFNDALIYVKMDYEDRPLQCYTKCIWDQQNAMREDGSIDMDIAIKFVQKERQTLIYPTLVFCENQIKHSDPCTRSMMVYKCLYDTAGKDFMFV